MGNCPTCGQKMPELKWDLGTPEGVLTFLKEDARRYLYKGQDRYWYITHSMGSHVPKMVVDALRKAKRVRRVYSDCEDAYGLNPTWDVEKTLAARQKPGGKHSDIYLPDDVWLD